MVVFMRRATVAMNFDPSRPLDARPRPIIGRGTGPDVSSLHDQVLPKMIPTRLLRRVFDSNLAIFAYHNQMADFGQLRTDILVRHTFFPRHCP